MYLHRLETSSFQFIALTEKNTPEIIMAAWKKHCKETGADLNLIDMDDINTTEISTGTVLRDGEKFYTKK